MWSPCRKTLPCAVVAGVNDSVAAQVLPAPQDDRAMCTGRAFVGAAAAVTVRSTGVAHTGPEAQAGQAVREIWVRGGLEPAK